MHKFLISLILIFSVLIAILLPGFLDENKIVLGGSTSVYPIWNKVNNTKNNQLKFNVYYNSIGSSAALMRVKDKVFAIGFMSRKPNNIASEKTLNFFQFATDYLVLVYNLPNSCTFKKTGVKQINVSKTALQKLFLHEKPTWKLLQTELEQNYDCNATTWNQSILFINRENGSGTRQSFETFFDLLQRNYFYSQQAKSTNLLLKNLKINSGTITYLSLPYLDDHFWKIDQSANLGLFILNDNQALREIDQNFANSKKLINSFVEHKYPFFRPFYGFYLKKHSNQKIIQILKFIKSKTFQTILQDLKFGKDFKEEY